MREAVHVGSVSGGVDSGSVYLLMMEWSARTGHAFEAVFADTGHEHPETYDYVRQLPALAGGPPIRWVSADFTEDFAHRRRFIRERWPQDGVSAARIERALALLTPTGNPYLDLALIKGRFPSRRAQFCTGKLKVEPIVAQTVEPHLERGVSVWSWQGVRWEEGKTHDHPRATLTKNEHLGGGYWAHRPIIDWTKRRCFEFHAAHGVPVNPLYRQGMNRVGCMPCINVSKGELHEIAKRFPAEIERVAEWERLVGDVAKKPGIGAFFAAAKTPNHDRTKPIPDIHHVVNWSKTSRGGRQFNLFLTGDTDTGCKSAHGLCE